MIQKAPQICGAFFDISLHIFNKNHSLHSYSIDTFAGIKNNFHMQFYRLFFSLLFLPFLLQSQVTIKGQVIDAETNLPISNVRVLILPEEQNLTTDQSGYFQINLPEGNYHLTFKHPFYRVKTHQVHIDESNKNLDLGKIALQAKHESLNPIIISSVTDFISDNKLPVSQSHLQRFQISDLASNRDLPEILNQAPSVYATKKGGGIGDSRINVRGFSQRNVAVLINGVPVNDMQTGWVYWSNWLNLPDITSNAQLQSGMGASKLAIPSVGGTINIITASASKKQGGKLSYEYSSYDLHKLIIAYNTGILDNGLSTSIQLGRIKGNGFVDMTGIDAYTYYFNLGYSTPNQKHRIMFNLLGSPQWHYQRNIAPKLKDFLQFGENNQPNIKYNSEWGYFQSKPYSWSKNYFHKPIASLNWDWQINDKLALSNVVYAMFGRGGGTGPVGAINYHYPNDPLYTDNNGQIRFDDIYTWNSGGHVPDFGPDRISNLQGLYVNSINEGLTRYAFINNHAWFGGVLNANYQYIEQLELSGGVDFRKTYGKNALTVNDVLGADAYFDNSDVNNPNRIIYPGDFVPATYDWNPVKNIDNLQKIIFFNQANINWLGVFGQAKYETEKLSAFLQAGWSQQGFQRIDYFNLPEGNQKSEWFYIPGGNIKTGIGWQINQQHNIFVNGGYFSKQPLFNAVFPNWSDNTVGSDLVNERIYSIETSYQFKNNHWDNRLNLYYTIWQDRYQTVTDMVNNQQVTGLLKKLKEVHRGIEWVSKFRYNALQLYGMLSIGDWYYQGNIKDVPLYNFQQQLVSTQDYYLGGVKVGDAAQFTAFLKASYKINKNWRFFISQIYFDKLYANIDVGSFSNPNHKGSLQLPAYSLVDAGFRYRFNIKRVGKAKVNLNVQNLFDKHYISESETNIFPQNNAELWNGIDTSNRVFFGWGRTYALKFELSF